MDYSTAIIAHSQWKARLRRVVDGTETVDVSIVSRDDQCPLGKWIHSDDARSQLSAQVHTHLREAHAAFHLVAGEVADIAQNGDVVHARTYLAVDGAFTRTTAFVVQILEALREGDTTRALTVNLIEEREVAAETATTEDSRSRMRAKVFAATALVLMLLTVLDSSLPTGPGGWVLRIALTAAATLVICVATRRFYTAAALEPLAGLGRRLGVSLEGASTAADLAHRVEQHISSVSYQHRLSTALVSASAAKRRLDCDSIG